MKQQLLRLSVVGFNAHFFLKLGVKKDAPFTEASLSSKLIVTFIEVTFILKRMLLSTIVNLEKLEPNLTSL